MADELGSVSVSVKAEVGQLEAGLSKARAETEKFDKAANKAATSGGKKLSDSNKKIAQETAKLTDALKKASDSAAFLTGPLGGVSSRINLVSSAFAAGAVSILAASAAFAAIALTMKAAIDEAEGWERNLLKTNAVLKATGFSVGLTSNQLEELTGQIKSTTLATGDGVDSAVLKLLTFRSVQGETFREAIALSQDLAAVGFGSVDSAATQLGKALEDPVNGLAALRRVGVSFSPVQKQMIADFMETGRVAEAQRIILDALQQQVGGAGAAEASGLSGAYHRLSESIADFLENIGKNGPLQATTGFINALTDAINFLNDAIFDTGESVDILGSLGRALSVFGPLGTLASNGISAFSASIRENNDAITQNLILEDEAQKRAAAKARLAAENIEAERKQGIAMEAAKKAQEAAAAAAKALNEQRAQTINGLSEEVRILGMLSGQYLNSGMSAEQLSTTGEILRTQSLLQVDANSAEGRSIEELITKRNALTGAIDKETKARELLKQETEATLEFNAALKNTIDARQRATDIDVASIGMGQKRAALQREINDVTFEYAKRLEDVARAQGTDQALPTDIFAARVEALKAAQAQEIAIIQEGAQRKAEAEMNWAAGARQGLEDFSARATDLAGQTSELVGSTLESMAVGVSDALAGAIIQGEDLRDTMANLAQTIYTEVLSALIEMGIRFVTNKVLQLTGIAAVKTAQIASTAATTAASTAAIATTTGVSTAAAATTTTAWAPAATMSSIGSFGAAAAIGLAAVLAALAMSRGFRDGGFTGGMGTNEIAGVVHGGEFVFDAAATSRIGVGNLEAIRSGAANDSIAAPKFQERIRPSGFDNNVDGQIVNPNRMNRSDRMINQNFYIQTPDADSFRSSQRQIARDTKQRMAVT